MKLYLVRRYDRTPYDEYAGFVVRAASPYDARKLASSRSKGEFGFGDGDGVWMDSTITECREIKQQGKSCVIISDYNAG